MSLEEREFNKVEHYVKEELSSSVRCRNDDKWLVYKVLRRYTSIYIPFEDFKNMPSFETITRVRRKLQRAGHYPATEDIGKRRMKKEVFVREWSQQ